MYHNLCVKKLVCLAMIERNLPSLFMPLPPNQGYSIGLRLYTAAEICLLEKNLKHMYLPRIDISSIYFDDPNSVVFYVDKRGKNFLYLECLGISQYYHRVLEKCSVYPLVSYVYCNQFYKIVMQIVLQRNCLLEYLFEDDVQAKSQTCQK